MLAKKCDRCGGYYDDCDYVLAVINRKNLERKNIDLCPRCLNDFQSWMKNYQEGVSQNAE